MCKELKTLICLLTLLCTSYLLAEELTYKFSPMADQVYQLRGSDATPGTDKPEGIALPDLVSSTPLFTEWDVSFAPGGVLHVAIDSSQNDSKYDRLYVDTNADGRLDDETAVTAAPTDMYQMSSSEFGPVEISLQTDTGLLTRHFKFTFTQYSNQSWLSITSVCWYQGPVSVDGQKMYCMLFDDNANGTFNDTYAQGKRNDQIRIGQKGELRTVPLSKYIQIDGEYYSVNIQPSGQTIEVCIPENLQFGTILLPENITELSLNGENGFYTFSAETENKRAPAGKYNMSRWIAVRTDETGDKWQIHAYSMEENVFEIPADTEIKPDIGEPLTSTLKAEKRGDSFRLSHKLTGKRNEMILLTCNGQRCDPPKLTIKNEDGSYNEEFTFEYG